MQADLKDLRFQFKLEKKKEEKQQNPSVQHRKLQSISVINQMEKKMKKYVCITESLCCAAEINTIL